MFYLSFVILFLIEVFIFYSLRRTRNRFPAVKLETKVVIPFWIAGMLMGFLFCFVKWPCSSSIFVQGFPLPATFYLMEKGGVSHYASSLSWPFFLINFMMGLYLPQIFTWLKLTKKTRLFIKESLKTRIMM